MRFALGRVISEFEVFVQFATTEVCWVVPSAARAFLFLMRRFASVPREMFFPKFLAPWCFVAQGVGVAVFLAGFSLRCDFVSPQWFPLHLGADHCFNVVYFVDIRFSVE
jgi:hypothetical protein